MRMKRYLLLFCALVFLAALFAGCSPSPSPSPTPTAAYQPPTPTTTPTGVTPEPTGDPGVSPSPDIDLSPSPDMSPDPALSPAALNSRAQAISQRALEVAQVKSAVVVLQGDTCLVGIEFADNVQEKATVIKSVETKVRAADSQIQTCAVSGSVADVDRIRTLAQSVQMGNTSNALTEFKYLLNIIMP